MGHAEFSHHMNKLVTDNYFKNVWIFKFSLKPSTSWFSVGIRYGSHLWGSWNGGITFKILLLKHIQTGKFLFSFFMILNFKCLYIQNWRWKTLLWPIWKRVTYLLLVTISRPTTPTENPLVYCRPHQYPKPQVRPHPQTMLLKET